MTGAWTAVALIVLAGFGVFYVIGRYASFFSKYLVHLVVGIPLFLIVLLPSLVIVAPFVGKDTVDVPVTIESIEKHRGGSTSYRPGRHGRVVEVGFNRITLSSELDGKIVTDAWTVPIGFGPFVEGQTVEGVMTKDGSDVQLAVRDVIRFPFTFGQLLVSLVPGAIFFMIFSDWIHRRRSSTTHRK